MNGKECRATRREIDESELNQPLSDQAQSHLARCAWCSRFRAERASLRQLVGSLEPVTAPGDFEMRLRARIASQQGRARPPALLRFVTSTPALAAAAVLVMLATSLVWLVQQNRNQPPLVAIPSTLQPNPATRGGQPALGANGLAATAGTTLPGAPAGTESRTGRQGREGNWSRSSSRALAGPQATDFGVSPAESYKQIEQRAGEVSLSAPLSPMVVSMQDHRGVTRRISLPEVSFGEGRLVDNRIPVSATKGRSW